jgi:CheY-like chemotaxis protein/two-component sensor histidine kinase
VELAKAKQEADRANEAKSEFLSRMSHELRTPLNAILGFGQLLELEGLAQAQRDPLAQILKAGRHLLDLINEVLDIARIESGRLSMSVEDVSVGDVVGEVLDLAAPMAAADRIALDARGLTSSAWYAVADRQRLKQVLLNLVCNAVKYNVAGGRVEVRGLERIASVIRLEVSDTGPGIPPEKLSLLFSPFERVGSERTAIEGTGLGLAVSKRLVEAMGGRIGVESRLGEGSTFWIELAQGTTPVLRREAGDDEVVRLEAAREGPAPSVRLEGEPDLAAVRRRVLYVEDNVSNLKVVEQLLQLRPAIELLTAMQGGLGLALAQHHHPDLILLDLHLPDMNGAEVLERLKRDPFTSGIPVAILTADATPGQKRRMLEAGADEYLTKPLDLHALLALLDARLAPAGDVSPGAA